MTEIVITPAQAARVYRAAKHLELTARRSRFYRRTIDNRGGFQLTDADNRIVAGERYNLTAEMALQFIAGRERANHGRVDNPTAAQALISQGQRDAFDIREQVARTSVHNLNRPK
jgi:hypothetical protein